MKSIYAITPSGIDFKKLIFDVVKDDSQLLDDSQLKT